MTDAHRPNSAEPEAVEPAEPSLQVASLSITIAESYQSLLGRPLLSVPHEDVAAALYHAPFALLAHDGAADPRFTYANLTAQRLWERHWEHFVGLPSRLSAEPDDRETRARMLEQVAQQGFIDDYSGIRVSASGQRFRIADAQVWNLIDGEGQQIGQAARIGSWQPVTR